MNTLPILALAFTSIAPAVVLSPGLDPFQAAALHARFDPSLGSMRAGGVATPVPLQAQERAELVAAQQQSSSLAALRGGAAPSNNEWTWLAIGAVIVLLIVLL